MTAILKKFLAWCFSNDAPPLRTMAAFIVTFAMFAGIITLTKVATYYGYGAMALVLWVAVPLHYLISEYRKGG